MTMKRILRNMFIGFVLGVLIWIWRGMFTHLWWSLEGG